MVKKGIYLVADIYVSDYVEAEIDFKGPGKVEIKKLK